MKYLLLCAAFACCLLNLAHAQLFSDFGNLFTPRKRIQDTVSPFFCFFNKLTLFFSTLHIETRTVYGM